MNLKYVYLVVAVSLGLPAPAIADQASFIAAFNICFDNVLTTPGIRQDFAKAGWQEIPGMSPEEFEYDQTGTHIYLRDTDLIEQPGCTVMDENVNIDLAYKLLVTSLEASAYQWSKGLGTDGGDAWRILTDIGTVIYTLDKDMSGAGAAISYEVRP